MALIGTGVRARIWVERADADLVAALDPSQQYSREFAANTRTTFFPLSTVPTPDDPEQPAPKPPAPGGASDRETDMARRAKADADRAEYEAEAARRKLALDEGRWMDAAAASKEWSRVLSEIVSGFEVFLATTLARDTADRNGLDMKAVSVRFREMFRIHRGGVSEDARARRLAIEAEAAPTESAA